MGAGQGVILVMSGVLVLYLLWAAKSPLNVGSQGGSQNPSPSPTPPGPIQIPPINIPPITAPPVPNPTDPCNPIYVSIWGPMDCENQIAQQTSGLRP